MSSQTNMQELLATVSRKIRTVPRYNICQDIPPEGIYYQHYRFLGGKVGMNVVKPADQIEEECFIIQETYDKIHGFLSFKPPNTITFEKGTCIAEEELTTEDRLSIGDLSQLLADYNSARD
ncbi:hypothetical protein HY484_02670 [Candidatus Woesearchaeota archaeon]|nr:hypothetical protein [Candidatus Woesearchaeota archaeon]